MSFELESLES